jgi:hypothetical protein
MHGLLRGVVAVFLYGKHINRNMHPCRRNMLYNTGYLMDHEHNILHEDREQHIVFLQETFLHVHNTLGVRGSWAGVDFCKSALLLRHTLSGFMGESDFNDERKPSSQFIGSEIHSISFCFCWSRLNQHEILPCLKMYFQINISL